MTDPAAPLALGAAALDRLLPMHLVVTGSGHIRHAGPTLAKVVGPDLEGRRFLDVFRPRRPRRLTAPEDLLAAPQGRVVLDLRGERRTTLRGLAQPAGKGELLVNLSFGIAVPEAVARHGLTALDFAATDLAVELLYLKEARTAVLHEAVRLYARLTEARLAAEQMAMNDPVTGLGNRRAMDAALAQLSRKTRPFGLMQLDLDFFKDVNDTLGHAAGDAVLVQVARILRHATRERDVLCRVGGDEFMILFPDLADSARLAEIAHRILTELERPILWQRRSCRISGSIGICTTAMYDRADPARMLSDVDAALYASKNAGRGTVTVFGQEPQPVRAAAG